MNDTPVIISGLKIGRYVKFNIIVFSLFFMANMPIAAAVPISVAVTDDANAIMSVFLKAEISKSFWTKRIYQSNVNPAHTDRLFDALNENMINMNIGIYKNRNTKPI
jgi:hypothetical protein